MSRSSSEKPSKQRSRPSMSQGSARPNVEGPPESAALSEDDAEMLADLKLHLSDRMPIDENLLIRFVRGYAKEAERWDTTVQKLTEALDWRKEVNADSILEKPLENEQKFFEMWPHDFHGFSKSGHPVYIEDPCRSQPADIIKEFPIETQQLFHVQMMEMLDALKRRREVQTGNRTYKHVVIMDLSNLGRKHVSSSGHIKAQVNIDQYYYPECLQHLYIINAPWVFRALWAMVKPWVHPLTADRIKILGSDYSKLKEVIDDENLPRYLGGACSCCPEGMNLKDLAVDKYRKFVDLRKEVLSDLKTGQSPEEVPDAASDHKAQE